MSKIKRYRWALDPRNYENGQWSYDLRGPDGKSLGWVWTDMGWYVTADGRNRTGPMTIDQAKVEMLEAIGIDPADVEPEDLGTINLTVVVPSAPVVQDANDHERWRTDLTVDPIPTEGSFRAWLGGHEMSMWWPAVGTKRLTGMFQDGIGTVPDLMVVRIEAWRPAAKGPA